MMHKVSKNRTVNNVVTGDFGRFYYGYSLTFVNSSVVRTFEQRQLFTG